MAGDESINLEIMGDADLNLVVGNMDVTTFLELTDAPSSYSGEAGKFIKVNMAEDGIEFSTSGVVISWGDIIGTLSDQTDLQAELDLKYDAADFNTDWDTRLATKDTDDLSEGSNLYYTEARVSANADVSSNTSSRHNAVTVSDGTTVNFTLTGQDITAETIDSAIDHNSLLNYSVGQHRVINDSGNTTTELFSSSKIISELSSKVDENISIIGATKTKVTYDSKGLIIAGTDATTADIADSTDKRYLTDVNLVVINNTSNTNTGDQSSSDFTHNDLGGLNDGDYKHLTATNHTDLTDSGDSGLHYHSTDRARANHTGTQTASTISDFDTEVSNNTDVAANTTHRTSDGSDHTFIDQDVTSGSSPTFTGTNITAIPASNVELNEIGTATYDDVQDWSNGTQSAGVISGGVISIGGSGTVDVSDVKGIFKTTDDSIGDNVFFDITGLTGQALTDNSTNYISVDYNSGTPQFVVGLTNTSNGHTIFNLGKVYREGTFVDIITSGIHLDDMSKRIQQHHVEEDALHFVSGAIVGETGTRNVTITAGVMYAGLNRITTDAVDTSGADTFEYYYYNGSAWIESSQSQIDNVNYNDIASGLVPLTANRYGVHWVYKGTNGDSYILYGQGDYTSTQAELAQPPSSLPEHVEGFGVLRAKIIIQKNSATFFEIQSVEDVSFSSTTPSEHNALSGLQGGTAAEYYHLTSAEHVIATQPADTTNSGYLLTADWDTFNEKQDALTFGIVDTNAVQINSVTVVDNDYAKFTATGLEGRNSTEVKTDLSLENVENTALSTWAGTTNITTLGTISVGIWGATDIAVLHGGTGASTAADARTNLDVDQAGTDNSTDVTLNASATTGGMSISTQEISNQAATNIQNGYMTSTLVGNIETNNGKNTNVPTSLSLGTVNSTTMSITSDGGADDVTLIAATTNDAGLLTATLFDEIAVNTTKDTNVSTSLSTGTITATTYGITSDGGVDDIVLPEANTSQAGLLGADKWDEIVANTAAKHAAVTIGTANGLSLSTQELSLALSSTSTTGALSDTDWDVFNGKMSDLVDDTTPQLGGDLDMNQKSLNFDPTPTSDHTWSGEIMTATAGESVVIGDVCYFKSDGKFWKVDADAEATTKGFVVMATGSISADATGVFLIKGFIRDDTWTWTVAAELFCHTTPGNPTETKPSATGDIVRLIGYAYSADIIYFNPDKTYIEIV